MWSEASIRVTETWRGPKEGRREGGRKGKRGRGRSPIKKMRQRHFKDTEGENLVKKAKKRRVWGGTRIRPEPRSSGRQVGVEREGDEVSCASAETNAPPSLSPSLTLPPIHLAFFTMCSKSGYKMCTSFFKKSYISLANSTDVGPPPTTRKERRRACAADGKSG